MRHAVWPLLAMPVPPCDRLGFPRSCAFSDDITLEALRAEQAAFVAERDWQKYHEPRSLALAGTI